MTRPTGSTERGSTAAGPENRDLRPVTDAERKEICFDMLCYFDRICRENNIRYSLTCGTLLGAVRHKGFIPWDDDVDVFLTRPEFSRLDAAFPRDGKYRWISPTHDPDDHELPYGRLMDTRTVCYGAETPSNEGKGLFLDVCVVDGLPDSRALQEAHMRFMRFCFRARRTVIIIDKERDDYKNVSLPKKLLKNFLVARTDKQFWLRVIEKNMKKYPFNGGKYVGNFTSQYGSKERMHRSSFASYQEMEFEGRSFMVIGGWEEYLTNIYGDYMQLPPEDRRKGHHDGVVYWKTQENSI